MSRENYDGSGLFWRFGLWRKIVHLTVWPAKLEVGKNSWVYEVTAARYPDKKTYRAHIEVSITPWVSLNLDAFYLELRADGVAFSKVEPDTYSSLNEGLIVPHRGYRLTPAEAIYAETLVFEFMVDNTRVISGSYITLEAGLRRGRFAIRKPVVLDWKSEAT